jgi:MYXO-CTERM domain-containing protein
VGAYGDDCAAGGSNCGAAYLFSNGTGAWREVSRFVASDAAAADALGRSIAISGDSVLAGAYGASAAYVFVRTLSMPGTACSADGECASGSCTDGVCCMGACGGGIADCQACSTSAGGTRDGECTALTPSAARAFVCRASTGACDLAETCEPTLLECPVDGAPACPDAGSPDAAVITPDAAVIAPDASTPPDAAVPELPDASTPPDDAAMETPDAGAVEPDAAVAPSLDASSADAGGPGDAGLSDGGTGSGDVGTAPDAGMTPLSAGCSCAVPGPRAPRSGALLLLVLGLLGLQRRHGRARR